MPYFDTFDQSKINILKKHLVSCASKNKPKYYEIFVDGLKAVMRTNDHEEFDCYEEYITPSTSFIKVVIYCSGETSRNDQYLYSFKAATAQEALEQGLDGLKIKNYTDKELQALKAVKMLKSADSIEIQNLKKELTELKHTHQERETHITRLENAVKIAKENGNKLGGIDLGELLGTAAKTFFKQNAKGIEKATGINGLGGFIETATGENQPEEERQEEEQEAEVTFKRKESNSESNDLSEQEKQFVKLCKVLQSLFTEHEMAQVMLILDMLSRNKIQIQPVLELLQD